MSYTESHPVTDTLECKVCGVVTSGDRLSPEVRAMFIQHHESHATTEPVT